MVKSVEATGKTIEIAIDNAYQLLGVDRDKVEASVEVIDRPRSGFFGIGSSPAKVRISIEEPDAAPEKSAERPAQSQRFERTERPERPAQSRPAQERPKERPERTEYRSERRPAQERPKKPEQNRRPAERRPYEKAAEKEHTAEHAVERQAERQVEKTENRFEAQEQVEAKPQERKPEPALAKPRDPAEEAHAIAAATAFLSGLLERMGASAHPEMKFNDEGTLEIELIGGELGMLIGRRGETLNAIQHITSHVVNKECSDRVRVTVDAENYRTKREETLRKLAHKTALKVVRYHRSISLEPMNAYERHVIHTALQDWRDVSTFSSGAEPRRCVVISYTPGGGSGAGQRPRRAPAEGVENTENAAAGEEGEAPRREYRNNNRRNGRNGRGRNDHRDRDREPKPQTERPKPKPLEEQVWE